MAPNNPLPIWGNEKTMNLNPLILTNIQSSPYFKVNLYELKTYHEVIDEIYYRVDHLEPWEKGSRKTAGQTGMCGGVRGVGAGGIVSSAYCLLYKLFTLRLTRKQVNGLIAHSDSPYIRGLGFMYIRYTQDPKELWDWFEAYLDDEEEIDVKAGGGHKITIGHMVRQCLVKLEWYSTLFPRIPVPVQKSIMEKIKENPPKQEEEEHSSRKGSPKHIPDGELSFGEAEKHAQRRPSPTPQRRGSPPVKRPSKARSRSRSPHIKKRPSKARSRSRSPRRRSPKRSPPRRSPPRRPRSPPYRRRSPHRIYRPRSPPRHVQVDDFARELEREKARQRREKERGVSRSRSPVPRRRSRSRSPIRERRRKSRSPDRKHHHKSSHDKHSRHSSERKHDR